MKTPHAILPSAPPATLPDSTALARSFLDATYTDPNRDLRLRHWRGQWYVYDAGCYRVWPLADAQVAMRCHIETAYQPASQPHRKRRDVTTALIANALDALRAQVFIPTTTDHPAWLDGRTTTGDVLHLADRLVELPSLGRQVGNDYPHSPHFFSVNMLPGCLDPHRLDPPLFKKFLQQTFEGDQARIRFVQEWMGYLLVPDTCHQQMLLMLGEGRNGKSVLLDVITDMLGRGNVSNVPLDQLATRFGLGPTEHKLVNICGDVGTVRRIDEGVLKQFVGGDMMQLEQKYQDARSFRPTARVMASANTLPTFSDPTSGLWRRIRVLPFERQVPAHEVDLQLTRKLLTERDSILGFAFLGLLRLRQAGAFTTSQKMDAAVTTYRGQNNPARDFLTRFYEANAGSTVVKDDVYQEFSAWCTAQGHPAPVKAQFGADVKRMFPTVTDGRESAGDRRYLHGGLARKAE